MEVIGNSIARILDAPGDAAVKASVRGVISELCAGLPLLYAQPYRDERPGPGFPAERARLSPPPFWQAAPHSRRLPARVRARAKSLPRAPTSQSRLASLQGFLTRPTPSRLSQLALQVLHPPTDGEGLRFSPRRGVQESRSTSHSVYEQRTLHFFKRRPGSRA